MSVRVVLPSHLRDYTHGRAEVEAEGATLAEVLVDLDARHPGLRFRVVDEQDRIRPHIKFFVGQDHVESIAAAIDGRDVQIVAALSGG